MADVCKVYQNITNPLYSGSLLNVSVNICLSFSDTSAGIPYLASVGLIRGPVSGPDGLLSPAVLHDIWYI